MTTSTFKPILASLLLLSVSALAQSNTPDTSILIHSDETARITIDGQAAGLASPSSPFEVSVTPGNHLVSAIAPDGNSHVDQVVQANSGQRSIVLIDLSKLRLQQAQATLDLQQKQKRAEQQQQCSTQLQAKRLEYQAAVQKYNTELQQAEDSAQDAASTASNGAQGGPQWLQGLNGVLGGLAKKNAADHQKKAAMLKVQVDQLRQDVSDLQRCASNTP